MIASNIRLVAKVGELLTREYASRFDACIKWIRNPMAVLLLALIASVLCGLFLHSRALILAAGLTGILCVGTIWPWLAVRGLSGTLGFDKARIREGEKISAHLVVRNRMPWAAWGLYLRGEARDGVSGARTGIAFVSGWHVTESKWELIPEQRGEYPHAIPRIGSAFPFGLWDASRPLSVPSPLLVWPRTFPVGPIPEAANGREGEGLSPRNKAGISGDLLGVRPYRRGDSLRRVHWPQSARHGHLIVCELESHAIPSVQIVVDTNPETHSGVGPESSMEWAIRITASFVEGWLSQGAEIEVVFGTNSVSAAAGSVAARRTRILDAMARVKPDSALGFGDVVDGLACRRFDGGLRVIVATNLSLQSLPERTVTARAERFVVLDASAFVEESIRIPPVPLRVRPWILVNDSTDAPSAIRRAWKEVHLDR